MGRTRNGSMVLGRLPLAFSCLLVVPISSWAAFPFRNYKAGTILRYEMRGLNDGKVYEAVSRHEVKVKGGVFYEEVEWERLAVGENAIDLAALKDFRQWVSLDQGFNTATNNFKDIPPQLMGQLAGPYFDLMTFYVDANPRLFGARLNALAAGKPLIFPYSKSSSWADGFRTLLGEDCIDFQITFQTELPERPVLRVEHIAPEKDTCVSLPESWMASRVGGRPNNWVQIGIDQAKMGNSPEYGASYGLEYFDSHIYLDPINGMIRSANLYNTVDRINRTCQEVKTSRHGAKSVVESVGGCGPATPQHTFRNISLRLIEYRVPAGRSP
ncbi:MAG: hypothetical protein A3J74_01895 [Elusimicrobia bacterium RIFCSPHIGHO2_02_FULL_57_9]|nr:MAG: hypothetical protein A3J74_01895 [Elusimicrobia bacterium RIFCSPHIGHO2_02_FULL_57_9]